MKKGKPILSRFDRLKRLYDQAEKESEWNNLKTQSRFVRGTGYVRPKILFISLYPAETCLNGGTVNYYKHSPIPADIARYLMVDPAECFYTSFIKYRKPIRRGLTDKELYLGKVIAQEEVRILNPTAIVVFDPIAGQSFLGLDSRNRLHNSIYRLRGIPVITITTPLNLESHNPHWRKYYLAQVEALKDVL